MLLQCLKHICFLTPKKINEEIEKIEVKGRSYLRLTEEIVERGLDDYDWTVFNASTCVNTCWLEYEKALTTQSL